MALMRYPLSSPKTGRLVFWPELHIFISFTSLLSYRKGCSDLLQITADEMHEGVANLEWTGLQPGDIVERKGERISWTVRRILKTRKNILLL